MAIYFHNNRTASHEADVLTSERISPDTVNSLRAIATYPSDPFAFCLANTDSEDADISVTTTDDESMQLSLNGFTWEDSIALTLPTGKTSDTIFVRFNPRSDYEASTTRHYVVATSDPYIAIYLAFDLIRPGLNEFDTADCQANRWEGKETNNIADYFEQDGEAVRIIEYTPLEKPDKLATITSLLQIKNLKPEQWCNPYNNMVGYTSYSYPPIKCFVGNREIITNKFFNSQQIEINFAEENAIIIPANFPGFCPSYQKTLVEFGDITPFVTAYQTNHFTIFRDNIEYALRNIKRINLPRGQIGFFYADLIRIEYPAGDARTGFLPWNILVNSDWGEISYVPSWSTEQIEDPYCGEYI